MKESDSVLKLCVLTDSLKLIKKCLNFVFLSGWKWSPLAVKTCSNSSFILMNLSELISSLIRRKLQESASQFHLQRLLCNSTVTQLLSSEVSVFSLVQDSALIKSLRTWTSSSSAVASAGWRLQPHWPKPARRSWFWSSTTRLEAAATPTSRRASSLTWVRSVPTGPCWVLLVLAGSCWFLSGRDCFLLASVES